jgi:hypothetical protein
MMRAGARARLCYALLCYALCPARAEACAACDGGNSLLTVAGTEQPFAGRLRSAAELRYRTDVIGAPGVEQSSIRELRADLSLAWAVLEDVFLIADVPWLYRRVEELNLARNESLSLGELELSAKWFFWRDRAFAPRFLLAALGGLKLPTAPRLEDASGHSLPLEAQPGTGSVDAELGSTFSYFAGSIAGYASWVGRQALWSQAPLEPGRSLRANLALQAQLFEPLALRAVTDLRWEQPSREQGRRDPNSGGSITFLGADLLLSPIVDVSVVAGARVPVLNRLHGAHSEGPIFSLALVRDW